MELHLISPTLWCFLLNPILYMHETISTCLIDYNTQSIQYNINYICIFSSINGCSERFQLGVANKHTHTISVSKTKTLNML
jgi:hypothetical protein